MMEAALDLVPRSETLAALHLAAVLECPAAKEKTAHPKPAVKTGLVHCSSS